MLDFDYDYAGHQIAADAEVAGRAAWEEYHTYQTYQNIGQLGRMNFTPMNGPTSSVLSCLEFGYNAGGRNNPVTMSTIQGSQPTCL